MFRDADIFESLALGLTSTYIGGATGHSEGASLEKFKSDYINGDNDAFAQLTKQMKIYKANLEADVPNPKDSDYIDKKRKYDTYCTILEAYRTNDTNYSTRDGAYEIYNGLNISNKIAAILDSELTYNDKNFNYFTNVIYDGTTGNCHEKLDQDVNYKVLGQSYTMKFGHTWVCLGYAVMNLIKNYIIARRNELTTIPAHDLIDACISLNLYEIDEAFINNYIYLNEYDFQIYSEMFDSIAKRWIARLLNQFMFHTLFGRANSWNSVIDKEVAYKQYDQMHGIDKYQKIPQSDSVDWYSNQVIDILNKLRITYRDFDRYKSDTWNFSYQIDDFKYRDDGTSDSDERFNKDTTYLVHYLITRTNTILIPDLNNGLRFMIQCYTDKLYLKLDDDFSNGALFSNFEKLLLANKTTAVPIESIQYSLYNVSGGLKNVQPVNFKQDSLALTELASEEIRPKIGITSNGTYGIGELKFSRLASSTDPNLILTDGSVNGIIQKIMNMSDDDIVIHIGSEPDSETITMNPGDYLALTNTSNNYTALKFNGLFENGKTSLTEKMDAVQSLSKETVYNEDANDTTVNSKDTDLLLNDPYFRLINDETVTPFQIDEEGRKGLISNIGSLMFVESNQDVLPSVTDFTKYQYTITDSVYSYNPDIYVYNSNTKEITLNKTSYKLFKYNETDAKIVNDYFKRKENSINVATRMGLTSWKTDINSSDLCLIKLPNYTEVPFTSSLTAAYNMTTADGKIHLKAGTTVASTLIPFIFSSFSSETTLFANSCSLLLPPVIYTCAITNKDVEKVISRSENSNQVYSFEPNYNTDLPQLTVKFSNEVKLTIPTGDTMYVFLSAPETPYAIPSGLARLDYSYIF